MFDRIYNKLEFNSILEQVSSKAKSKYVKNLIVNYKHEIDYDKVVNQLENTDELMRLFLAYQNFSLAGLFDILPLLSKVNNFEVLSGLELNEISSQQELLELFKDYYKKIDKIDEFPFFKKKYESLSSILDLAININRKISPNGLVYDDATVKLVRISHEIEQTNHKISSYLSGFIADNSDHLMDTIVTYRNNRAVVLVKISSKNTIKGIIHDESSSKQTAFIEPSMVVEYNNYIQSLEYQKNEEIEVVLSQLSKEVFEYHSILKNNYNTFVDLDLVKARAIYSLEIDGIIPKINKDSAKLEIFNGRHPLIPKEDVVANDFFICNNETKYRIVLISGSNTGGKTVALKMVGLFSLMAQSGLAISANEKSNLPIYSKIFVDIGDEQSIVNSLSTFSAHLSNVSNITKHVSKYSLVLLDELGSGTDPREGENLALAILEYLYQKDASVVVTTHYSKLKNYALTTKYVRSASVLFDDDFNRPRYKISFDTFASSNAFEIASYLGLDDKIVSDARKYYSDDLNTSDELMLKLQKEQQSVKKEQETLQKQIKEYEYLIEENKKEYSKVKERNEKIILSAKQEANKIISESKNSAQLIIDELKKQDNFVNHKVNDLTKEYDKMIHDMPQDIDNSQQEFRVNDLVEIIKINRQGVITRVLPRKNYEVTIGNIKTKVKHNEIRYLSEYKPPKEKKMKSKKYASKSVKTEINLIGLRVEDALIELTKYLDDALLANLGQVRIVHGFGTGALRKAVHDSLRTNKNVKKFYFAEYNEGGQGATIADLK